MEELPQESVLRIFSFLHPGDSYRVCMTCKQWNELWQDKMLWKLFHNRHLGGKPPSPLLPKAWKKSVLQAMIVVKKVSPLRQLFYAIRNKHVNLVDEVLSKDPSLAEKSETEKTSYWWRRASHPFEVAAEGGGKEVVQLLVEKYYKSDNPSIGEHPQFNSSVTYAMTKGQVETLRYLCSICPEEAAAAVRQDPRAVCGVCSGGHLSTLQFLVEEVGVVVLIPELLKESISARDKVALPHWILDKLPPPTSPPSPRSWYSTPLYLASYSGDRRLVKRLLFERGETVEDWAELLEKYGDHEKDVVDKKVLKWFLRKHEEQMGQKEHNLALYCKPIKKGDKPLLEYLIKIGAADVSRVDPNTGKTLLHFAVEQGLPEMVKILLDVGADPKLFGKKARSVLTIASQKGMTEIYDMLTAAVKKKGKKKSTTASTSPKASNNKRKREEKEGKEKEEKEEEKEKETETRNKNEKEKESDEEKKPSKKKPKVEKEVTEKVQEERKLDARVMELVAEIEKILKPMKAEDRVSKIPFFKGKKKFFDVHSLRQICKHYSIKCGYAKKIDMLKGILEYLENVLASAIHET